MGFNLNIFQNPPIGKALKGFFRSLHPINCKLGYFQVNVHEFKFHHILFMQGELQNHILKLTAK